MQIFSIWICLWLKCTPMNKCRSKFLPTIRLTLCRGKTSVVKLQQLNHPFSTNDAGAAVSNGRCPTERTEQNMLHLVDLTILWTLRVQSAIPDICENHDQQAQSYPVSEINCRTQCSFCHVPVVSFVFCPSLLLFAFMSSVLRSCFVIWLFFYYVQSSVFYDVQVSLTSRLVSSVCTSCWHSALPLLCLPV